MQKYQTYGTLVGADGPRIEDGGEVYLADEVDAFLRVKSNRIAELEDRLGVERPSTPHVAAYDRVHIS